MPLPADEPWRIQSLRRYQILDTPPEQEYDDLVKLAAHICQVPTALVSLVDHDRQWFKAKVGLDVCETARDVAFCAHAILQPHEILVVPDATQDPRFCDNPLVVKDPKIRFYAGCPLVTPQGMAIGTICVIDYQPRQISAAQIETLAILGRQTMSLLEMRLALQAEQRLDQLRSRLITLIAHEFRTPLGIISSSAGILEDYGHRLDDVSCSKHHQRIQASVAAITQLIDEAVALDNLDHGQFTPALNWCDAQAIIQPLATTVEKLYNRRVLYQTIPESESVPLFTDRYFLEQVALTLLINAVQHSPQHSPVYLNLIVQDDALLLRIEDQGEGMPSVDLHHAQTAVPAKVGNLASVGIGLAYSKRLADLMGWQLSLHSELSQGTTTYLHIPQACPTAPAISTADTI